MGLGLVGNIVGLIKFSIIFAVSGNSIAPSNEQGISHPGMSAGLIPGLLSNFNLPAIPRLLIPRPHRDCGYKCLYN